MTQQDRYFDSIDFFGQEIKTHFIRSVLLRAFIMIIIFIIVYQILAFCNYDIGINLNGYPFSSDNSFAFVEKNGRYNGNHISLNIDSVSRENNIITVNMIADGDRACLKGEFMLICSDFCSEKMGNVVIKPFFRGAENITGLQDRLTLKYEITGNSDGFTDIWMMFKPENNGEKIVFDLADIQKAQK